MVPERAAAGVATRGVGPAERLTRAFVLSMVVVTAVTAARVAEWPWLMAADLLALVLVALVARAPAASRFAAVIGLWYPFLLFPAFYGQLGFIGLGVARTWDPLVQHWEVVVFGEQVSMTWHQVAASPVLSSVLHACYLAYYVIFVGVPLVLWLRVGREAAARAVFGITLVFYVCYLLFAVFPVAGPYYALPAPTGPQEDLLLDRAVRGLLDRGASWGTAFPSSHVAASWCAVLMAWRDARWLAVGLAPVAVGLAAGTVYGQFHYAVDAVAGAAVAVLGFLLADRLRTRLARPGLR